MSLKIQQLFVIAEQLESNIVNDKFNYSDVIVYLENGEKYIASFFTYASIKRLRKRHQKTGEYLNGIYFHVPNMLLIDNCSKENVNKVVLFLIDEGDFKEVFKKISE